jgi:hypothetical protein
MAAEHDACVPYLCTERVNYQTASLGTKNVHHLCDIVGVNILKPVVCFLLGNSPASEFYMPTFRNTLFHLHRRVSIELILHYTPIRL